MTKSVAFTGVIVSIIVIFATGITSEANKSPAVIHDDHLVIQKIASGFDTPSGFEFVGKKPTDILIIQKDDGEVKLIKNFMLNKYPILDLNASNQDRGMSVGIASRTVGSTTYVFLSDNVPSNSRVLIYRYEWNASGLELDNPILILDLPSTKDGGKVIIGPDGQLYSTIGYLGPAERHQNLIKKSSQCIKNESSAILRTTIDGLRSKNNPISKRGFESFYVGGISNPYGLAFDPVTKYLWDSEQGPGKLDKFDLFKPGFDRGWKQIQEISNYVCCLNEGKLLQSLSNPRGINASSFEEPKYVTAITFVNSSALGNQYSNNLFVSDLEGNIYGFNLDLNREKLVINHNLYNNIFATGFGSISDMKIGPDGALYVLTFANNTGFPPGHNSGGLYRISNNSSKLPPYESQINAATTWGLISTFAIIFSILIFLKMYKGKQMALEGNRR